MDTTNSSIAGRIDELDKKLDALSLQMASQLATISGQIISRADIAAEDNKRVSVERFDGEISAVRDRLLRLESGPQRTLAYVGIGTGCLSVIIAGLAVCVTVAAVIIPHIR